MDRRDFIKIGALASGGLLVGFNISGRFSRNIPKTITEFNSYLKIDSAGRVTIIVPVPEIGQGVRTSLPMLVAEELEVDWDNIIVEQADAGDQYEGGNQRAAGSNSVRVYWEPMRRAGATAREMLMQAAANEWSVTSSDCYAANGKVFNKLSGDSVGYGEVASKAALLAVPTSIKLKSSDQFKILGKEVKNHDVKRIVNGSIEFGQDVRLPGMHYASIEKCQVYGGTIKSYDATEARSYPGITHVFKVPFHGNEDRPFCREGIAVVGTSAWAVLQARKLLNIDWDLGPNVGESTDKLHKDCLKLIQSKGNEEVINHGNVDNAFAMAEIKLDETYHVPFIAHIPMETVNCTIDLKKDHCEIWSTTQMPYGDRAFIARLLDMPVDKITLHIARIGGGFGRRLGPDFSIEAVKVAKEIKAPVQFFWSREDDIQFDSFRPFSYHRMQAGIDQNGKLISWLHRQAGTSRYAFRPDKNPSGSEFFPNNFPANLITNFRQEYSLAPSNISRSLIRAPGNNALAFVVESFIDEVAHAIKMDPLKFRLSILGEENRDFDFEEGTVISTERMRNVLLLAAGKANWGKHLPKGRAMGIAGYFTFETYVAHVAEVSVDTTNGVLKIHKFTSAVDCGTVASLDGVKAQTEGAIMDGISATLHQEITISEGRTEQSNFQDYRALRMSESPPDIEVHVLENDYPPTGMGEPPYPPVAPALCNAIFAACGIRIRKLPIRNQLKV